MDDHGCILFLQEIGQLDRRLEIAAGTTDDEKSVVLEPAKWIHVEVALDHSVEAQDLSVIAEVNSLTIGGAIRHGGRHGIAFAACGGRKDESAQQDNDRISQWQKRMGGHVRPPR